MSGFIRQSACHGHTPSHLSQIKTHMRSRLIADLMKDRGVPRFVFAPSGYGKTTLAAEYAETVFSFAHVFWMRCVSPCFLRDLDSDVLAKQITEMDPMAALAVFDDVPVLDDVRAQRFSDQIDILLQAGCEVLVLANPSADLYVGLQTDRVVVTARDLLLSDKELETCPQEVLHADADLGTPPITSRIPQIAWDVSADARKNFIAGILSDDMPDQLALAQAYMLFCGKGNIADVLACADLDDATIGYLMSHYPHLGIEEDCEQYSGELFTLEELATPLRTCLGKISSLASATKRDAVILTWADQLYVQGSLQRACAAVRLMLARRHRGSWTARHAYDLIRKHCYLPLYLLVEASRETDVQTKSILQTSLMICKLRLDGSDQALALAKRAAFSTDYDPLCRLVHLCVLVRYGATGLAAKAGEMLPAALLACDNTHRDASGALVLMAQGALAYISGHDKLNAYLHRLTDAATSCSEESTFDAFSKTSITDALFLLSAWLFDSLASKVQASGGDGEVVVAPSWLEAYVRDALENHEDVTLDAFLASAGLALEQAHTSGVVLGSGPLSARLMMVLRQVELSVLSQRMRYEIECRAQQEKIMVHMKTNPDLALMSAVATPDDSVRLRVPRLSVKMFGRFELRLGDQRLSDRDFSRQKVKRLLMMLVINNGRELPRDSVCESLWPSSPLDVARRNYYAVLSALRRLLTLPDGTCPYLIRHRYGCVLDTEIVTTDIARLDDICRELLFGQPDEHAWGALFREVDKDFSDDLVPSENSDPLIEQARNDLRQRLTDALTAGAQRITEAGYPYQGIWFARAAVNRDKLREDAYLALMSAQAAAGQRASALLTFLSMRKILVEELGVDPSPSAVRLYETLLDGDEAVNVNN